MTEHENAEKRNRTQYRVQLAAVGDTGTSYRFSVSLWVFAAFLAAAACLAIAALSYCFILAEELDNVRHNEYASISRYEALEKQNETLLTENEELQEKVAILSDTVNSKVQREQEREAEIARSYIPTGFPLRGTASYSDTELELEGNPIAVFQASQGTSVVATANGTVSSIAGDTGVGYIVMIDHGNGYYTVYRNGARPKVKEGDTVTNVTELFNIEAGSETLGYQIIENEQYIDPLSLMETYG